MTTPNALHLELPAMQSASRLKFGWVPAITKGRLLF